MQLLDVASVGSDHTYRWPSGYEEPYPHWIGRGKVVRNQMPFSFNLVPDTFSPPANRIARRWPQGMAKGEASDG
jgi:hypothetical protein